MARTGINLELVVGAAEQIVSKGESPTIEKIRFILGAGSNTTISKYLKEWRDNRPVVQSTVTSPPDQVQAAVSAVWEKLHQETELTIETIKAETDEKVAAAQQEAQVANDALQSLKTEHEALKTQYHALSAQKELLTLDYKQSEANHQLLGERLDALQTRHLEIKTLHEQQLARLEEKYVAEIERLNAHADQEVKLAQQLTDTLKAHYEDIRTQHMRERDELSVENRKKEALIKRLEVEQATLKQTQEAMSAQYHDSRTDLAAAQALIQTQQDQWKSLLDKRFVTEEIVSAFDVLPAQVASELRALLITEVKAVIDEATHACRQRSEDVEHA